MGFASTAVWFTFAFAGGVAAPQEAPNLQTVLSRASAYVAEYETQLGNLIGEETYVQNASWRSAGVGPMGRGAATNGSSAAKKQRLTQSDFLILQVGPEWIGVRNVNRVDGAAVKRDIKDFQQVFDESPAAIRKTLESISDESARYNIGDITRTTNVPTFALKILRASNLSRFEFRKTGEGKESGVHVWTVSFRETESPSLITDLAGHDEFATGVLWIDPETGRILKTELGVRGAAGKFSFRSQMTVSFGESKSMGMLVPSSMTEHYETDYGHVIDCRAEYSNFRRFQVDVNFDIAPPPTGRPTP